MSQILEVGYDHAIAMGVDRKDGVRLAAAMRVCSMTGTCVCYRDGRRPSADIPACFTAMTQANAAIAVWERYTK